ncbi:o-succinylbenzoate synthase [Staphylococcus sp. 17KM0847]|uniref:o-succinylbenzoate synthase n=1 Tax=Staphylococcus sp. 17KM0847 TaxID=2583989 RepID=UPI0015DD47CE|nr:o-succinylbenzoate synthase [Staphylococcus sp. 17KM0847]QLK86320.1 o-succinylbenzoate synthase [Staphylococcus sp. 17KM0847]
MKLLELHFYHYAPVFKHKIQTPKVIMEKRETLFIGTVDEKGKEWFGECNAFETDWYHFETIDTVKHVLSQWFEKIRGREIANFKAAQELLDDLNETPAARATMVMAMYQMFHQLPTFDIPMTLTINGDMEHRLMRLDRAGRIKIKWNANIVEQVKMLTTMYPHIPISTDANQTLSTKDKGLLEALKHYNLAYIEEPFESLDQYEYSEKMPSIAIDEHATDQQTILEALSRYDIRVVIVKPFRLGGIDRALELIDLLRAYDVSVVIGGMYECGLSRYFTALLSQKGDYAGDITPTGYYFIEDIVDNTGWLEGDKLYFEPPIVNTERLN